MTPAILISFRPWRWGIALAAFMKTAGMPTFAHLVPIGRTRVAHSKWRIITA